MPSTQYVYLAFNNFLTRHPSAYSLHFSSLGRWLQILKRLMLRDTMASNGANNAITVIRKTSCLTISSKQCLPFTNGMHIWQVPLQVCCEDTSNMNKFNTFDILFCKITLRTLRDIQCPLPLCIIFSNITSQKFSFWQLCSFNGLFVALFVHVNYRRVDIWSPNLHTYTSWLGTLLIFKPIEKACLSNLSFGSSAPLRLGFHILCSM